MGAGVELGQKRFGIVDGVEPKGRAGARCESEVGSLVVIPVGALVARIAPLASCRRRRAASQFGAVVDGFGLLLLLLLLELVLLDLGDGLFEMGAFAAPMLARGLVKQFAMVAVAVGGTPLARV